MKISTFSLFFMHGSLSKVCLFLIVFFLLLLGFGLGLRGDFLYIQHDDRSSYNAKEIMMTRPSDDDNDDDDDDDDDVIDYEDDLDDGGSCNYSCSCSCSCSGGGGSGSGGSDVGGGSCG